MGDAQLTPATLPAFADTQVADTSASQRVMLRNAGTGLLGITSIRVTGDYLIAGNDCPASLISLATCNIDVSFRPLGTGTRPGMLHVDNNGSSGNRAVPLTGNGRAQSASLVTPVDFGNVTVGAPVDRSVTLSNNGVGTLSVSAINAGSVTGIDFSFVSTSCASSVPRFGTCLINVRFSPTAALTRDGTLTVSTGAGIVSSALRGAGTAAARGNAQLTPATLSAFADTQVGQTSAPQSIELKNVGTAVLAVGAIAVSTADFDVSSTCPASLAVNAPCTITVRFKPASSGSKSATLTVNNDGSSGNKDVALNGMGRNPSGSLTPALINFGNVLLGNFADAAIRLDNTGVGALVVGSASFDHPAFTLWANSCPASLPAGASGFCTGTLRFTPTTAGTVSGTFTLNTGAGPLRISLQGTGNAQGNASLSATALAFPATQVLQTTSSKTVAVTNIGTAALLITAVEATPAAEYLFTHNCSSVAVGLSCTVSVSFKPALAGSRPGSLTIRNNGSSGDKTVTLSGEGRAPAGQLTPNPLNFGVVTTGTISPPGRAVLQNIGIGPLNIIDGPYIDNNPLFEFRSTGSTSCLVTLNPGDTCWGDFEFTPAQIGLRGAIMRLRTEAGWHSITLQGSGTGTPPLSTPAGRIDLVGVQHAAATTRLTIANGGNAALSAISVSCTVAGGSVLVQPSSTLVPGASTEFTVAHPAAGKCMPRISASDASNSPFTVVGY